MNVFACMILVSIISYAVGWYWHDKVVQDRLIDRVRQIVGIEFDRRDDVWQLMSMLSPLSDEDLRRVILEA